MTLETAEFLADTVIRLERGRRERGVYRAVEVLKSRARHYRVTDSVIKIHSWAP